MAKAFSFDLSGLQRALEQVPDVVFRGAEQSFDDIKDDWTRGSRDVAPLETSNLRRQIHGEVGGTNLDTLVVEMAGNATQQNGSGRFNYGYYIHEGHMAEDGKQLQTPGTVEQYLDQPAEQSQRKWREWVEEEVQDELDKAGW